VIVPDQSRGSAALHFAFGAERKESLTKPLAARNRSRSFQSAYAKTQLVEYTHIRPSQRVVPRLSSVRFDNFRQRNHGLATERVANILEMVNFNKPSATVTLNYRFRDGRFVCG